MTTDMKQKAKCLHNQALDNCSGSAAVAILLCMVLMLLILALLLSLNDNTDWFLILAALLCTGTALVVCFKNRPEPAAPTASSLPVEIVIESLSDAVIACDTSGRIILFNPCAEELTGFRREQAMGEPVDEVCYFIDSRSGDVSGNAVAEALQTKDMVLLDEYTQIMAQDDEQYFVAGSVTPVYDHQGTLNGVVLVMRDISEQRKLQRQLSHADKMRSIGQLAGGIAHDFNNMLGAIMGAAQVLDTIEPQQHDKHKEYTQLIMRVSENAAELIRNLMAFSRNNSQTHESMLLNQVIEQTANMLQHVLHKSITVTTHITDKHMHCTGDQVAIQSVILNLALNAQDAMPDGGEITIGSQIVSLKHEDWQHDFPDITSGLYARISLSDTGCGMSSDTIARIFEPFFTTKDRGKGTGLGLAMVYGTINAHQGCLNVASSPGKGSCFDIYLPLTAAASSEHKPAPAADRQQAPRVLLIDDDAQLRPIMQSLIESLGQQVLSAANGQRGLELYRQHQEYIQIVLLDLVMQEMSGRAVFEALQAINPDIKVALISGYDRGADAEAMLEQGAIAYLRKPFSMQELLKLFKQHVDTEKRP